MKLVTLSLLFMAAAPSVTAQDDESREQGGLTYIGNRPGTNTTRGADARLSGMVEIQGYPESKNSQITVTVQANGVHVASQTVKNKGAFNFTGVPRNGVTLMVEVDNQEVGSLTVGTLTPPPMSNRKDIFLIWNGSSVKDQTGVVSVKDAYQRSAENQKAFDKAMAGRTEKNKDNSIKLLNQIVAADAIDYITWTELGNFLFMDEKYSESEKAYDRAIVLKSDFVPALVNLGKLHLTQKKFEPSIEVLTAALAVSPDSAEVNQYLGEAYLQAKKGSKAVVHLNKAIELAPMDKAEIHLRLANLYHAAGLKDRAAAEYKMFLEKVPNHSEKAKFEKYILDNTSK